MGDFIRFILTGENDLTLEGIERGLKEVDAEFAIFPEQSADNSGDVLHASEVYGEIEINHPDDQVFEEDIEDLREQLEGLEESEAKAVVVNALAQATAMIAFQLSEAGHERYGLIDPFWDWLFEHFPGLLQIDEEGYYTQDEQLLFVE